MLRRTLTILLTVALAVSAAPGRPLLAGTTFMKITNVLLMGEIESANLDPGTVPDVDRVVQEIRVGTDRGLDSRSVPSSVVVTDHTGKVLTDWGASTGGGYGFAIYVPKGLPAGETYTVRIKGGSTGLQPDKSDSSDLLAADYVVSFRTVERPTKLTRAVSSGNMGGVDLLTHDVLPRNSTEIELGFDRPIDGATVQGNITVTDSQGNTSGWEVGYHSWGSISLRLVQAYLPKNETYTIRIKGGPTGLRSQSGVVLDKDIVVTVHTDDQSYQVRRTLISQAPSNHVIQNELYRITAATGPLTIWLSDWLGGGGTADVVVEDPQTPEILLDTRLSSYGRSQATITLPRDGTYLLAVTPRIAAAMDVTGQDLFVSNAMPVVALPEMEPFAPQNGRFSLTPVVKNPMETGALRLLLNDTLLRDNALKADGTVDPVVIDPRNLPDGIYRFKAMARAKDAQNVAMAERTFLVDRESSFTDVPATHWARRPVEVMHHLGILNGRTATEFAPGVPVTRAEFAKMLALALGLKPSGQAPAPFVDVPDDWSNPHIAALAEHGLIQGETVDGRPYYYPTRTITRAEATTIVGRVLGIADKTEVNNAPSDFTDYAQVPIWARPSVQILSYVGWVNGFPDGRFGPAGQLNRDQAAKLLANFIGF